MCSLNDSSFLNKTVFIITNIYILIYADDITELDENYSKIIHIEAKNIEKKLLYKFLNNKLNRILLALKFYCLLLIVNYLMNE